MGVWGTGLFDDDLTCDVRDEFLRMMNSGASVTDATEALVKLYADLDEDEVASFWISLAVTQKKYGVLLDVVKSRALEAIEDGLDLRRWEGDSGSLGRRKRVLARARTQLLTSVDSHRSLPKIEFFDLGLRTGDIAAFQLSSGAFTILRVLATHTDAGSCCPVIEICDWIGTTIPECHVVGSLPHRMCRNGKSQFLLVKRSKRASFAKSIRVFCKNMPLLRDPFLSPEPIIGEDLDEFLTEEFVHT